MVAIGDIHGCLDELKRLLKIVPEEELIFLGDYVDRGPKSAQVIDFLINLKEDRPCIFLRGNHDQMMLDCINNPDDQKARRLWLMNGGRETLKSYLEADYEDGIPPPHVRFLSLTAPFHETEEFFFVHAGINPHLSVAESRDEWDRVLLWTRDHWAFDDPPEAWEKCVVVGHTIQEEPVIQPMRIGIDTGAFLRYFGKGGSLTAIHLPSRRTYRVL